MLGHCAAQHTKIADRILAEGHDVGCHSNRHLNAWKVHPWAAVADLNAGYERLSSWVAENGMYRPPYGKMTFPTYVALRQRHATAGWWTIDSGDTHNPLPEPTQVADRLMREGGGVVLMHDLDRSKDRNDFVLETTALLLDIAKRESFQLKRLSEICH
jgi:peptidoglycan/xylan/chitin deacetylase (PgdA/CDA1 family)